MKFFNTSISLCMSVSVILSLGSVYPSFADDSNQTKMTAYSDLKTISKFNPEEFKKQLNDSKNKILESKNTALACDIIEKSISNIKELKTDLYINQHLYWNDNLNYEALSEINSLSSYIYESELFLSDFISELSENQSFSELKDKYSLHIFDKEFNYAQTKLVNEYYSENPDAKLSEIYIKLVNLRNSTVNDGYPQFVIDKVYNAGYTVNDLQKLNEQVKELLVYVNSIDINYPLVYSDANAETTISETEKRIDNLSFASLYSSERENGLFRYVNESDYTCPDSITSYLYSYNEPIATVIMHGKKYDELSIINEFGKMFNRYYQKDNYEYSDEKELLICYLLQTMICSDPQLYISSLISELRDSYVTTAFEIYAYTETELTSEKLDKKYYEIRKSIGYNYSDSQTSDNSWVNTEKLYSLPLSQSVSMVSALNSIQFINSNNIPDSEKVIVEIASSDKDIKVSELLKRNNLVSCLDEKTFSDTVSAFKAALPTIFSDKKTENKSGDVCCDGIIDSKDLLYLRRYLQMDNKMPENFSIENADTNKNGKVDVFDLIRLKQILLDNKSNI